MSFIWGRPINCWFKMLPGRRDTRRREKFAASKKNKKTHFSTLSGQLIGRPHRNMRNLCIWANTCKHMFAKLPHGISWPRMPRPHLYTAFYVNTNHKKRITTRNYVKGRVMRISMPDEAQPDQEAHATQRTVGPRSARTRNRCMVMHSGPEKRSPQMLQGPGCEGPKDLYTI